MTLTIPIVSITLGIVSFLIGDNYNTVDEAANLSVLSWQNTMDTEMELNKHFAKIGFLQVAIYLVRQHLLCNTFPKAVTLWPLSSY